MDKINNMIKAIIFDLNGVFIVSRKLSDRFKESFGIPHEEFLPALKEAMTKARMPGAGDAFSYWKVFLDKWKLKITKEEFFTFCFNEEKEDQAMFTLAHELKSKDLKLFILSNNFSERVAYYEKHFPSLNTKLDHLFDKIYYSWQTGLVKPDPRCFQKILEDNNLQPGECLYFDDSQANVDAATKLGIKSYIFENAGTTKEIISSSK